MKKIVMLGALLVLSPVFAFASANKLEPYTVVPVVKNDKDHHDQKAHDTAHAKHPQKQKKNI